jgi:hypothetical protein
MRKRTAVVVLLAGAVAVLSVASYATADSGKTNFDETLIGYLEVPAVSTEAGGSFQASLEDDALTYRLTYSGLEGSVTQAHIHFGQRSVNGGISIWLCSNLASPPTPAGTPACPAPGGTVTRTVGPSDVVGPAGQGIAAGEFDEIVEAIQAGRAYANVHSSLFPGGEIRAQLNDENQRDD